MKATFVAVLRVVALLCLAVTVVLVIASIIKGRADLFGEAIVFYVLRIMLVKTAAEEEAYQQEQEAKSEEK